MANEEHLAILRQGVEVWNRWREENAEVRPDISHAELNGLELRHVNFARTDLTSADLSSSRLEHADFSGADAVKADLRRADLRQANLRGTNSRQTDFNGADLRGANLRGSFSQTDFTGADLRQAQCHGADLIHARFNETDMTGADLSGANLFGAGLQASHLRDTNLTGAELTGVIFGWNTLSDVDLKNVLGLEKVRHFAPSTIGIDTIYRSCGEIPDTFLRGAGVPENFITYARSLVGKPIEFYSCFISYSTADQAFADRLHSDLQSKGVRCWFAPHDIRGGRKLQEQIDEAIRVYDRLLLIISPASMSSEWVGAEIAKARKREQREKRQMLFPVRLVDFDAIRDWEAFDADTGKDSAREIREYFIPDFSRWKDHDAYQAAFDRLLRDLKAAGDQRMPVEQVD
jgi:uncharacterized protein YjbI with pentapeptide repeats